MDQSIRFKPDGMIVWSRRIHRFSSLSGWNFAAVLSGGEVMKPHVLSASFINASVQMSRDSRVSIMCHVIEVPLESSEKAIFHLAYILYSTCVTGKDIDNVRTLAIYFGHAGKDFSVTV